MIYFKNIILDVLTEADTLAPPSTPDKEKSDSESTSTAGEQKTVVELFFKMEGGSPKDLSDDMKTSLNKIKGDYELAYGSNSFPQFQQILKIYNAWKTSWTRTSASAFESLAAYFPVISFMADVATLAKGNTTQVNDIFTKNTILTSTFSKQVDSFKTQIKNRTSGNPIDWYALTPEAQYVQTQLRKKLGQNYLAQVSLDKFNKNSIKEAIFYMLEARKKARMATLPTASVPDQGKAVLDVLLHPDKFSGGEYAFSNKVSSDKIYTRAIHTEILDLGLYSKAFFRAEAMRLQSSDGSAIATTDTMYEMFLNNSYLKNDEKGEEKFAFITELNEGEVLSDIGVNGYTIENIQTAGKNGNDPAKDLYELLLKFANYVREGEITDWIEVMRGGTKIATGLSFGAQTVGGKR
jgi:hypothetical protein